MSLLSSVRSFLPSSSLTRASSRNNVDTPLLRPSKPSLAAHAVHSPIDCHAELLAKGLQRVGESHFYHFKSAQIRDGLGAFSRFVIEVFPDGNMQLLRAPACFDPESSQESVRAMPFERIVLGRHGWHYKYHLLCGAKSQKWTDFNDASFGYSNEGGPAPNERLKNASLAQQLVMQGFVDAGGGVYRHHKRHCVVLVSDGKGALLVNTKYLGPKAAAQNIEHRVEGHVETWTLVQDKTRKYVPIDISVDARDLQWHCRGAQSH